MKLSAANLEEYMQSAIEAARRAGAVLIDWQQRFSVREKGRFDLVTEADLASQETVRGFLQARYPEHACLGEEDPDSGWGSFPKGQPTWIVDPLDGTTNYVHGNPVFAVSIGLAAANELAVGVIFDPSRNEMFRAARGLGAWLGDHPLHTSSAQRLEEALLSTGFPPDVQGQTEALAIWHYFSLRTQSLRRTGSTSLNMAYVAAGRHDGFWATRAFAWDCAAGAVIIREAGGIVSQLSDEPYDLRKTEVLASNGPLHPVLLKGLRAARAEISA
jgi:myo-inositol-1(or 4)-monophosphatase